MSICTITLVGTIGTYTDVYYRKYCFSLVSSCSRDKIINELETSTFIPKPLE